MQGFISNDYYTNATINKPIEEIYRDIDGFTYEITADQPERYPQVDAWVVLPPLHYEGKLVKGLLVSPSMELLIQKYPMLSELFVTCVTQRWSGYPWSTSSEVVLNGYDNPARHEWFLKNNPHRQHQVFAPFEHESDGFLNEYVFAPPWAYVERDIDVISVSRLDIQKNVPMIAEAAKVYIEKYNKPYFKLKIVVGKDLDLNGTSLSDVEKNELKRVIAIQEQLSNDNIELISRVDYGKPISEMYAHSKLCCIASILEGNCRAQREAQYSNTPVVMFKDFNKYTRGEAPIFPEKSGRLAPEFSAESLADTWHEVLENHDEFKPRESILKIAGRKNYYNDLLKRIPYYCDLIPDLTSGHILDNIWLDCAVQANYETSFYDWIYAPFSIKNIAKDFPDIDKMLYYYFDLFDIPFESKDLSRFYNKAVKKGGKRSELIGNRKRPVI